MKHLLKLATILLLCGTGAAFAHDKQLGPISIEQPWSRATVPAVPTGVAYFVVRNASPDPDRLLSVTTPVAEKAELHAHIHEGNMVRMRKLDAIAIAPASNTALEPGGLHVMLLKLKQPLIQGQTFPLTLVFERAGTTTIQVAVQAITDTSPSHKPDTHHHHHHESKDGHKH